MFVDVPVQSTRYHAKHGPAEEGHRHARTQKTQESWFSDKNRNPGNANRFPKHFAFQTPVPSRVCRCTLHSLAFIRVMRYIAAALESFHTSCNQLPQRHGEPRDFTMHVSVMSQPTPKKTPDGRRQPAKRRQRRKPTWSKVRPPDEATL